MATNNVPEQRAYEYPKLVTIWGQDIRIIYPEHLKPLEQDQEALKALVRYYASIGSQAENTEILS